MTQHLEAKLRKREKLGNMRQLQIMPKLIDFSSNDYLGLARSSSLANAVRQECSIGAQVIPGHNGLGSTGSRLLTGNTSYAQELENRIAQFHGYHAGLLFNCGYMANIGLLSTVADHQDHIFFDATVHASTREGIRLCRAKAFPFRHNDLEQLENRLRNCSPPASCAERFICIESIYSTDGSLAPLPEICLLAKAYNAHLIVDEAHAIGACGPGGRGLIAQHNLSSEIFAQVITFGKALGTFGAIVLSNHTTKQALINFATSYIYTTALPFYSLAAIKCSYELFPQLEEERSQLQKLIKIFQRTASNYSTTHVQAVRLAGNKPVKLMAKKLASHGYDVRALMSPTVQRGGELLRICLHAFNTEEEVMQLLKQINA